MSGNPTDEFYQLLNQAYAHFNQELFENCLPWCMLTLQRSSNTMGYFSAERWVNGSGIKAHEIALNPAYFARNRVIDVLQTMVHEQCHLWQHVLGRHKSRTGYHNREWSEKMQQVGLMPSSTGEVGGRKTGQSMSDYPISGGPFLRSCYALCAGQYSFKWIDTEPAWQPSSQPRDIEHHVATGADLMAEIEQLAPALLQPVPTLDASPEINWSQPTEVKRRSKSKYSCSGCGTNVWGKPGLNLLCGDCGQVYVMSDQHQDGGIE